MQLFLQGPHRQPRLCLESFFSFQPSVQAPLVLFLLRAHVVTHTGFQVGDYCFVYVFRDHARRNSGAPAGCPSLA